MSISAAPVIVSSTTLPLVLGPTAVRTLLAVPPSFWERLPASTGVPGANARHTGSLTCRVHLLLEQIVGTGLPPVHDVYVGCPGDLDALPRARAGALPFYGLEASSKGDDSGATGLTVALDVTGLFEQLARTHHHPADIGVLLVPRGAFKPEVHATIGSISLAAQVTALTPATG